MRRVEGNAGVRLLECTNPVKDKWRVRWDVQAREDGSASYMEEEFGHKPTDEEIRSTVMAWYNSRTDATILSGFQYDDMPVWLSGENQFNYKSAYDLAVQTGGATLPVTFKFGTDTQPIYRTFETLEQLTDFYTKAMSHIQSTLADGWKKKDAFDLEGYRVG
jgi:hypothetical protein bfra3_16193|nr:MAG TPA: protein of unknown function (DUF4376) [Caudoviricetes sp.]